jgi:hypothetical protein
MAMKAHRSFPALLLVLAACGSTPDKKSSSPFAPAPDPNAPPPVERVVKPNPWTDRFLNDAVLVAAEVHVEGPVGLIEHLVTWREEEVLAIQEETTSAGFRQTFTLKPGVSGVEIRAQLDKLKISALSKLVVLERPGPVDVLVTATGNVFWKELNGATDKRAPSVRIEGKVAR